MATLSLLREEQCSEESLNLIKASLGDKELTWKNLSSIIYQSLEEHYESLVEAAPLFTAQCTTLEDQKSLQELQAQLGLTDETLAQATQAYEVFAHLINDEGELLIKPTKAKGKYDLIVSTDLAIKNLLVQHLIEHAPKFAKLKLCLGRERDPNFTLNVLGERLCYEDFLVFVEQENGVTTVNIVCSKLNDKISAEQLNDVVECMFRSLFGDVIARIIAAGALINTEFDIPEKLKARMEEAKRNNEELFLVNLKDFYKNYMSHGGKSLAKENNHLYVSSYRSNEPCPKDQRTHALGQDIYEIDTLQTFAVNLTNPDMQAEKQQDLKLLKHLGVVPVTIALSMKDTATNEVKSTLSRMGNNQLLKDCERYLKRTNEHTTFKIVGSALGTNYSYLHVLAFDYPRFTELMAKYPENAKVALNAAELTTLE